MSPLFGDHNRQSTTTSAAQLEVDRLSSLSMPQLASEVMMKGFGPSGPNRSDLPSGGQIVSVLFPDANFSDAKTLEVLNDLVAEGLQVLEHACLVRSAVVNGVGGKHFKLTRLGRAALEQNAVDRILDGGNL